MLSIILLIFLMQSGYGMGYSLLISLIIYIILTSISVSVICTVQKDNTYIPDNINEIKVEDYFLNDQDQKNNEYYTIEVRDKEGNILRSEEVNCSFFESLGISCDTLHKVKENDSK